MAEREPLKCDECGKTNMNHANGCDVTMKDYCDDCYQLTDCAKGLHGEGCYTLTVEGTSNG